MKLKKYNAENCPVIRNWIPTVRLNPKPGTLAFSKEATRIIDLKSQDKIVLFQDEEKPKDWYVKKTEHENGLTVRCASNSEDYNQVILNSAFLVREILQSCQLPVISTLMKISNEPTKDGLFAIITSSAK